MSHCLGKEWFASISALVAVFLTVTQMQGNRTTMPALSGPVRRGDARSSILQPRAGQAGFAGPHVRWQGAVVINGMWRGWFIPSMPPVAPSNGARWPRPSLPITSITCRTIRPGLSRITARAAPAGREPPDGHPQADRRRQGNRGGRNHHAAAGVRAGRRRDPALLLPRTPVGRRQLPHVPGGMGGRAQAAGVVRAAGEGHLPQQGRHPSQDQHDLPMPARRARG